jgi:hypothetical protein
MNFPITDSKIIVKSVYILFLGKFFGGGMVVFRELRSYLRNIINNIEHLFRLQFLNVPS